MPGAASFPTLTTSFTAHVTVDGGKQDAVKDTVGSRISSPSFVDNALHHAIYKKGTDVTGRQYTVTKPLQSDFQVTHGKRYGFTEEEESLLLTHQVAPGVKSQVPAFFNTVRMQTGNIPPVLLFAGDSNVCSYSITTADKGSRLNLRNLKGKTLKQLGMDTSVDSLRTGQLVNVGLRTTDIALRLFKDKDTRLNSVGLTRAFSGSSVRADSPYKGASTPKHSVVFFSGNLIATSVPNALRALARHDFYSLRVDRFGNFLYTSQGFGVKDALITDQIVDDITVGSVIDVPNRMTVKGVSVAINDNNEITLDDTESQKIEGSVKAQSIQDPTATNISATKRSAKQMLRLSNKAKGSMRLGGIPNVYSLMPGDVVTFQEKNTTSKQAIINVSHDITTGRSDVSLISYDVGLERVLSEQTAQTEQSMETSTPSGAIVEKKDKLMMGTSALKTRGVLVNKSLRVRTPRVHSSISGFTMADTDNERHSGFLIGHRAYDVGNAPSRGGLGVGVAPRTSGSISSTTLTVTSTTGFPSTGHLLMRKTTSVAAHVVYTGKTSTTFTGVSLQAPSGGSIPTGTCEITMLRAKSHEVGVVKGMSRKLML